MAHLRNKQAKLFTSITREIYFTMFGKLLDFLFISSQDLQRNIKVSFSEKCEHFFGKEFFSNTREIYISKMMEFYAKAESSTIFNENFNKNTLQNMSNILIACFDIFDIYFSEKMEEDTISETLLVLNEYKSEVIKKIFTAFLNEKILSNLRNINEETTINFFDTEIAVNNSSAFAYTKEFLKKLYKSYKNIIEFYLNILKKTKDVVLEHEIITLSYFYTLKNFYIKFIDFYNGESETSTDLKKIVIIHLNKIELPHNRNRKELRLHDRRGFNDNQINLQE